MVEQSIEGSSGEVFGVVVEAVSGVVSGAVLVGVLADSFGCFAGKNLGFETCSESLESANLDEDWLLCDLCLHVFVDQFFA